MNPYKTLGIVAMVVIILLSATIANGKFSKWNTYKQSEIIKSYLDLLEDETGGLGAAGQKKLMERAVERSIHEHY